MRQYSAFEYVQDVLKSYQKSDFIVSELKSDALKECHWRQLFKNMKISGKVNPLQMTLGHVYDLDLTIIRDVIIQAQGEMALEEYLKRVRETWTSFTLDLVNY